MNKKLQMAVLGKYDDKKGLETAVSFRVFVHNPTPPIGILREWSLHNFAWWRDRGIEERRILMVFPNRNA